VENEYIIDVQGGYGSFQGTSSVVLSSVPQRRQAARELLPLLVRMLAPGKEEVMGRCVDIGLGGLCITSGVSLPEGIPLSIRCTIGEDFYLNVAGQIVYGRATDDNSSRTYGIKFVALRHLEQKILDSAIQEFKAHPNSVKQSLLTFQVSQDYLALEALHLQEQTTAMLFEAGTPCPLVEVASETGRKRRLQRGKRLTANPSWVLEMDEYLKPYREAIWQSKLVQETSTGELSLKQVRGWSVQFYPFIEYFPQFMATYLAKAPDHMSRAFLIDNLRVEKRHADQWVDMANGFGVTKEELITTPILPEVETLTHWLWSITNRGSFVEAVAATNYAIEGVTQGIASIMVKGFARYQGKEGVCLDKRAYYWMEAHSSYDDVHPYEALEIIKRHATSPEIQHHTKRSAQRSLEYLAIALDRCYQAYSRQ
jgi:pyrroloquinoline quinone (PQQ) biosynthesis protein C